jgi:CheY-like chemotaxis protein
MAEAVAGASVEPDPVRAMEGNETVLVVEDHEAVRKLTAGALRSFGYQVIPVGHAAEAIARCERERVDIVLTDVVMPNMSGAELANHLRTRWPAIKVLFMSGFAANDNDLRTVMGRDAAFIQKPFSPGDLAGRIRSVLDAGTVARGATILVADDFARLRKMLAEILREAGYAGVEARDGVEALELLGKHHCQLALLDAKMPRQGGLDAAREMQKRQPGIRTIVMSAAFEEGDAGNPAALGVDRVLPKPVEPKVLLETVRRLLATGPSATVD